MCKQLHQVRDWENIQVMINSIHCKEVVLTFAHDKTILLLLLHHIIIIISITTIINS